MQPINHIDDTFKIDSLFDTPYRQIKKKNAMQKMQIFTESGDDDNWRKLPLQYRFLFIYLSAHMSEWQCFIFKTI